MQEQVKQHLKQVDEKLIGHTKINTDGEQHQLKKCESVGVAVKFSTKSHNRKWSLRNTLTD